MSTCLIRNNHQIRTSVRVHRVYFWFSSIQIITKSHIAKKDIIPKLDSSSIPQSYNAVRASGVFHHYIYSTRNLYFYFGSRMFGPLKKFFRETSFYSWRWIVFYLPLFRKNTAVHIETVTAKEREKNQGLI